MVGDRWIKSPRRGGEQEEQTVRVGTLAVEVEKMKSEPLRQRRVCWQTRSWLSGSCATQASEWEKSTETRVGPKRHRENVSHDGDARASQGSTSTTSARGEGDKTVSVRSPLRVEKYKERRRGTSPRNSAQFIHKAGQDE